MFNSFYYKPLIALNKWLFIIILEWNIYGYIWTALNFKFLLSSYTLWHIGQVAFISNPDSLLFSIKSSLIY